MRKTFPLHVDGKHPDRVLDAVKHDIRKYLKRERSRAFPEGFDRWDFDCKFGATQDSAEVVDVASIIDRINALAAEGGTQFYVEILAKGGKRTPRAEADAPATRGGDGNGDDGLDD
jgi:hypothetical protein